MPLKIIPVKRGHKRGTSSGWGSRHSDYTKVGKKVPKKFSGRTRKDIGGRANLLEEVGRLDAEKMNPNRRAEKRRVIGELNKGYATGGPVSRKKSGWKLVPGSRAKKSNLLGNVETHGGGPDAGTIGHNKDLMYRAGKHRKKMEKWKKKPMKELKPYRAKKALGGVAKILGKKAVDWIKKNRKTIQKEIYSPEGKKKTQDLTKKLQEGLKKPGHAKGGRIGLKGGSRPRPRPQGPHMWVRTAGAAKKGFNKNILRKT